jgi:hypothetical protein
MAVKLIGKGVLLVVAAAMVLMSIPMFQQSLIGGFAFLVFPIGWAVFTLLRTIFKSIWGCFFLFLGLGLLEVSVKTGFPLSWFAFGYLFVFYTAFKGIKWFLDQRNKGQLEQFIKPVDGETGQGSRRSTYNYANEVDYFNYFE